MKVPFLQQLVINIYYIHIENGFPLLSHKPGFQMVVTVVKIESRSFSSAEIQHFRTENREYTHDLYVVYRYKLL